MSLSIPQSKPRYQTVEDIYKGHCPICGHFLYTTSRHIGGYAVNQPFVACANIEGGEAHHLVRITEELARDYWLYRRDMPSLSCEVA